ncbi:MAG: hypothetical protein O3A00_25365 [Planctomycetota bacterium]|nr:hypothetical protein [Planctomycetota bacterium]
MTRFSEHALLSTALRFTVVEYERMIDRGVFVDRPDDVRIELINGEIREVSPPSPSHVGLDALACGIGNSHASRTFVLKQSADDRTSLRRLA